MKTIRLTQSEIDNASGRYHNDEKYTIIRRPQANGKYMVAAVTVSNPRMLIKEIVDTKEEVRTAVREMNRWMDKCYGGGKMSHDSRRRRKELS
jgi:hypothetical protein